MFDSRDEWVVNSPADSTIVSLIQDIVKNIQLIILISVKNIASLTKLSFLGFAWQVINAIVTALLFVFLFNRVGGIEVEGLNYLVFAFVGTAVWGFVNSACQRAPICIVGNREIVTRVYFPRIILAVVNCMEPLLAFGISLIMIVPLMLYFDIEFTKNILLFPVFFILLFLLVLGYTLLTAAVNSKYRDVGYLSQYFLRLWMWITPVAYPFSVIPEKFHPLYFLNPAAGIVESIRWCLLSTEFTGWVFLSFIVTILLFYIGIYVFSKHERTMIDFV